MQDTSQNSGFYLAMHRLGSFFLAFSAALLLITMLAVVVNTFSRYVFNHSFYLVLEMSSYTMLLVVFLSLAGTHMVKGHISTDLLLTNLPPRARDLIEKYFVPPVSIFYVSLLVYAGVKLVCKLYQAGETSMGNTPFLLWPIMLVVPLGCIMLLIILVMDFWHNLAPRKEN